MSAAIRGPLDRHIDSSVSPTDKRAGVSQAHGSGGPNSAFVNVKPYSVFTSTEKWVIVVIVSCAGMFSPLTANIYFPAIPLMVDAFHKSTELINLTITIYMVMQGLSPMLWGTLSDRWGRRPMFIGCMVTLALSCVGLALVPTSAYWLLMLLRCLQAFGSASSIALAGGVIGDIATRAERGGFIGFFAVGPMVGPSIGPIIGGGLAQSLGWRSIFWFLCITSGICAVVMLLILPETLRAIVGDGGVIPPPIYRPLIPVVARKIPRDSERPPHKPFRNPLLLFTYPDVIVLLVFNGTLYSLFYAVTASISTLFEDAYPFLNTTDIGLCFLAIGGGMVIGTVLNGKLLDRDYQVIRHELIRKLEDTKKEATLEDIIKEDKFPIEKARLRSTLVYSTLFVACSIGYGWCIQAKVSLAGPLILQVIIGFTIVSVMNTVQTLLVDLFPSQGSSITACNNLIRCSLGAATVSVVDFIIQAVGAGWTYVILSGWCVAVFPLLCVELRYGPIWRERRRMKLGPVEND
ncbi:MFS general substrate transporter [Vararia minispora EC-137]|uniref:MFS general substrate transporter n=1 Tax=Vararia minispora EC-137 TaxID=1314806 RepID=A0ACB8QQN2_9AGAM|nr:MFS general substrate transporter [Vararia minispora EC-137]